MKFRHAIHVFFRAFFSWVPMLLKLGKAAAIECVEHPQPPMSETFIVAPDFDRGLAEELQRTAPFWVKPGEKIVAPSRKGNMRTFLVLDRDGDYLILRRAGAKHRNARPFGRHLPELAAA